jgi:hypothetical protein
LLALLWERNQRVLYVPGLTVDRARDAYRSRPSYPNKVAVRRDSCLYCTART